MRKDVRIGVERAYAFLQQRAGGIAHADNRGARLARQFENLDDLARLLFAHRAAQNGVVLREHVNRPSGNDAAARDNAAVLHENVGFHEAARIQKGGNALTRGKLAAFLLLLHARGVSVQDCLLAGEHLIEVLHGAHAVIASVP